MRIVYLIPVLALAACGGGAENKTKATGAAAIAPGQYQVTAEVTAFRAADEGTPKFDTPVGTRTTRSVCVPEGGAVPSDLFADEGFSCSQDNSSYLRNGSINSTILCTRDGMQGDLGYTVTGTFDEAGFQAERQFRSLLVGDGDVVTTATLRGQRTGACTTAAPAANGAAPAPAR